MLKMNRYDKGYIFSFSRFGKLFYKEISENWKLYGLQVLVMYVAMAITLIWYSYTDYTSFNTLAKTNDLNVHIFTLVFWMWSWWIFICLGTSFAFKTMKGKTGRITMLMTPVTAFEKFFFRWLIYVLVLPLLILLSIWLADYTRVFVYSAIYPEMPFIEVTDFKHFVDQGDGGYSLCHSWVDGSLLILLNVYIQSFFLLGSIIWPKNSFIKTLIAFVLFVFLYYWVVVGFSHFTENSALANLNSFIFKWGHVLFPVLTIINWVLTYFRLKESEVIHRM